VKAVLLLGFLIMIQTSARAHRFRIPVDTAFSAGTLTGLVITAGGLELAPGRTSGTYESPLIGCPRRFDRAVPFWNATTPPGSWVQVRARVFRGETCLCDWMLVSTWSRAARGHRDTRSGDVTLDQDTLMIPEGATALQLQVALHAGFRNPRVARLGACTFDSKAFPTVGKLRFRSMALAVPYRTQRSTPEPIAMKVCGPTSLSMAMQYYGVPRSTEEIAQLARDPAGPIEYGNWAYLAAAAGELGFDAEVAAFDSLDDVVAELKAKHPVIMALAYEEGRLRGAPISRTSGHLILARGLTKSGRILVNDPAGFGPADGQISYDPVQLVQAWKRGVAILLHPPVAGRKRPH
jgi:hypothetical protein